MIAEFQHSMEMYNERLKEVVNNIKKSFDDIFGECDVSLNLLEINPQYHRPTIELKNPVWHIYQYDKLHEFIKSLNIDFNEIDIRTEEQEDSEGISTIILSIVCNI